MTDESTQNLVSYVMSSTARRWTLRNLAGDISTTDEILKHGPFSRSSAYNAMSELEDAELIYKKPTEETDHWALTGVGLFVSDILAQIEDLDSFFEETDDYWSTHTFESAPMILRWLIPSYRPVKSVTATETDPLRVTRLVQSQIEDADWVHAISSTYIQAYDKLFSEESFEYDPGVIYHPQVVSYLSDEGISTELSASDRDIRARLCNVPQYNMTLTNEAAIFSFPMLEGESDIQSALVFDGARSIRMCLTMFMDMWYKSQPMYDSEFDVDLSENDPFNGVISDEAPPFQKQFAGLDHGKPTYRGDGSGYNVIRDCQEPALTFN